MTPPGTHIFDRSIKIERIHADDTRLRFVARLSREMWVGESGPWGGYLSALLAQAIGLSVPELGLASLSINFVKRLEPGSADITVDVESRGSRVAQVTARVGQGDRCGAIAVATLCRNPQPDFVSDFGRPQAPPPDVVRRRAESTHPYMQHFDIRPTTQVRPWSGDNEGTLQGWIGLVDPRPLDVPLLVALPDAWTPGTWARLTTPAGKITVGLTVYLRADVSSDDTGWWFLRVRTRHVERGVADEDCEVWGADGRLLAQSRQLILLGRSS